MGLVIMDVLSVLLLRSTIASCLSTFNCNVYMLLIGRYFVAGEGVVEGELERELDKCRGGRGLVGAGDGGLGGVEQGSFEGGFQGSYRRSAMKIPRRITRSLNWM
jgi:hypothetical protein